MSQFFGADFDQLQKQDPDIAAIVLSELDRQRKNIQLIASENFHAALEVDFFEFVFVHERECANFFAECKRFFRFFVFYFPR